MKKLLLWTVTLMLVATFSLVGCKAVPEAVEVEKVEEEVAVVEEEEVAVVEEAPGDDEYDLTYYCIMSILPDFDKWLSDVESATGLKINVIAAPIDADMRQQKVSTVLSAGDSSIDILDINDEMATSFKNTGWLEPLQDTVLTDDIIDNFPQVYIADMSTSEDGDIIALPGPYCGYLSFWVDQAKLDKYGFKSIDTKEDFIAFAKAASEDGNFGYGGSWEKTYVFNEIGTFVNLFGGDYFDWTNPANKEAIQFMYDMVNTWKVTPIDQIADRYEQMDQKFIDGKYAMLFMWGTGQNYKDAERYGEDQIHLAQMPQFTTRSVFIASWCHSLNSASENKEAAIKVLQYMASEEGEMSAWNNFDNYPARADVAQLLPDNDVKDMFSLYAETCVARGRPMLPQTMEFITDIGTIFQSCMQGKITVDEFCVQAQQYVEKYK